MFIPAAFSLQIPSPWTSILASPCMRIIYVLLFLVGQPEIFLYEYETFHTINLDHMIAFIFFSISSSPWNQACKFQDILEIITKSPGNFLEISDGQLQAMILHTILKDSVAGRLWSCATPSLAQIPRNNFRSAQETEQFTN